jgi:molybdopterin synthase catalytic subunit
VVGVIFVEVSDRVIDSARVNSAVGAPGHGAWNFFFGAIRETNHGREVVAVSYDAFVPLAERTLHAICEEARSRWGESLRFHVVHRTGRLAVGELSVAIAVSAPHRDEAYLASRYVIEEIKTRAPIWKKEFYSDGETSWLRGHALCGRRAQNEHELGAGG